MLGNTKYKIKGMQSVYLFANVVSQGGRLGLYEPALRIPNFNECYLKSSCSAGKISRLGARKPYIIDRFIFLRGVLCRLWLFFCR